MSDYLTIDKDLYFQAYNDPDIIYNYDAIGNDKKKYEYLSWGNAYIGLKRYHPSLLPQLEGDFHYVDNLVLNPEPLTERLEIVKQELSKVSSSDYRKQYSLKTEIAYLEKQLNYSSRGVILKPYLLCTDTGKRTPSISFPVMDNTNTAFPNPDIRELTDNIQRSFVKAIGIYTGYGFRFYTRENIGDSLEDSDVVKAIRHIHSLPKYKENKDKYESRIHLGQNIDVLRSLYAELKEV